MLIKNGQVLTDNWQLEPLEIEIAGSQIAKMGTSLTVSRDEAVLDAAGGWVLPGLVDIHIHACAGHDFCDADPKAIHAMARHLARRGITSFLGTSMALSEEKLARIFETGRSVIREGVRGGARLQGIHMEGPFFAVEKKGAQSAEFIIDPDLELFKRLEQAAGHHIQIIDVAPERPGALELVAYASSHATVSIAHTVANYQEASAAFHAGASHVTHLFNAMPPFHHRDPGVVGAASDAGASVELICDGIHLHPGIVRSVFKWFGPDKVVLVSDAMRACGLADGRYELGGQAVQVSGNRATLADGTLAGSVTDLMQGVKNAISFGIPLVDAIRAATLNPAKVARIDQQVGSLTIGKQADLLVVDPELNIRTVIIGGVIVE